jgi:lathosterol oxidase
MSLTLDFLISWLLIYIVLLGIFFIGGYLIIKINTKLIKIQNEQCSAKLVRRDMRQSVFSLLNISALLSLGMVLNIHGYALFPNLSLPIYMDILALFVSLILFDTWFYWIHRLLHTRKLFRYVHAYHHKTRTPVVWSNNSDTLLDNLFLQSYWLFAAILLPIPIEVLIIHKIYDQISGMIGHSGYEYAGPIVAKSKWLIGATHHDQHHQHCNYNYATHFQFWDRWMKTLYKDYETTIKAKAVGAKK